MNDRERLNDEEYYEDELTCERCDSVVGYGYGDFNCTYICCPQCLIRTPVEPPLSKEV